MTEITNFFTPYRFTHPDKTSLQSTVEVVDSYFNFGSKHICVHDSMDLPVRVEIEDIDGPSCCSAIAKVVSYFSILLPVLMLIAKIILRACLPNFIQPLEPAPQIENGDVHKKLEEWHNSVNERLIQETPVGHVVPKLSIDLLDEEKVATLKTAVDNVGFPFPTERLQDLIASYYPDIDFASLTLQARNHAEFEHYYKPITSRPLPPGEPDICLYSIIYSGNILTLNCQQGQIKILAREDGAIVGIDKIHGKEK